MDGHVCVGGYLICGNFALSGIAPRGWKSQELGVRQEAIHTRVVLYHFVAQASSFFLAFDHCIA